MIRRLCPLLDDARREEWCRAMARIECKDEPDGVPEHMVFVRSTGLVVLRASLQRLAVPACFRRCGAAPTRVLLVEGDAGPTVACDRHAVELLDGPGAIMVNVPFTDELRASAAVELEAVAARIVGR